MGRGLKLFDGNNWVDRHANVKIFDGHNWQYSKAKVRLWDGRNWVLVSEERHETTWNATWSRGYWSDIHGNSAKQPGSLVSYRRPVQGNYSPFHDSWDWGDEGGMIGFDDGNIRSQLSGARIESVWVYLYSLHWYYYSGGEARIGTHNSSNQPNNFYESNSIVAKKFMKAGNGYWVQLPNWVGDNFRDGKLRGITVKAHSRDGYYYGYFAGAGEGGRTPKLKIAYWK